MPLFEYRCRQCGHVTVFLESPRARGRHACEECGSTSTERIFSTFAARSGSAGSSHADACAAESCPISDRCPNAGCMEDR